MDNKLVTLIFVNPAVAPEVQSASPFTNISNNQTQIDKDVVQELIAHLTGCGYQQGVDYKFEGLDEMQNGYDNQQIHGDGHLDSEYFPSGQTDTAHNMKGKAVPGINNPHMHSKGLSEDEQKVYDRLLKEWNSLS